ncbi:hypothetical protein [Nocardia neocaledoniensis]|uniref:hypothetical protein n=1 Tax=Nocardia neocaledoniensis TaxID=236511 RepID=UPI002453DAD2|nr:hypothetical protein [Nocardia neocaledoniensis]
MTTSAPGPGESVTQWQGRILRRIQQLAAQHREVTDAGPAMFDDGVSGGSEQVWNERLELLTVQREHAEYTALLGGVDPGWVVDARELGQRGADAPKPGVVRQHPARANQAQEFYLDMLELDLWTMERMAGLEAARMDRIATGRWAFDTDPIAVAQFADNMTALHTRVTVLAAAAQLTPAEGGSLWGSSVEGIRRVHAVTFAAYTEQDLARAWNGYARADPALAVPPYVPRGPDVGAALLEPPTPRTMIADATSALRSQLVDTAIRQADPIDLAAESTAITAVVDAALGEDKAWSWEPDPDPVPGPVGEIGPDRGPDL